MPSATKSQQKQHAYAGLDAAELLALLAEKDQLLDHTNELLDVHQKHLCNKDQQIQQQSTRIRLLEEYLHLARVQRFGASSEKTAFQSDLFDEAELEVALSEIETRLPDEDRVRPRAKTRKRGFSEDLERIKIHLTLTDDEKAGAVSTFFSKVKEELEFIPAQIKVLEYWQEKAVFETDKASVIVTAQRPVHPFTRWASALPVRPC